MSSDLPLISIALCTYNGERFIKDQVDSLVNQTYPNIEIIICDDVSTDQTYYQLQSLYGNNPKIKLYQNPTNLGFVNNFSQILNYCKGEYIALCDQDDIWLDKKITTLYNQIEDNILIYSDSQLINTSGEIINKKVSQIVTPIVQRNPRAFVFNNSVPGHTMMFHSRILDHVKPIPTNFFHDWWIAYIANCTGSIKYVNECLVYYRQHQNSITDILGCRGTVKNKDLHCKDRIQETQNLINWLNLFLNCEQTPEADKNFLKRLIRAYENRAKSYFFSTSLFYILLTNLSLFKIENKPFQKKLFYITKESFGLQTKTLFHKVKHSLIKK